MALRDGPRLTTPFPTSLPLPQDRLNRASHQNSSIQTCLVAKFYARHVEADYEVKPLYVMYCLYCLATAASHVPPRAQMAAEPFGLLTVDSANRPALEGALAKIQRLTPHDLHAALAALSQAPIPRPSELGGSRQR